MVPSSSSSLPSLPFICLFIFPLHFLLRSKDGALVARWPLCAYTLRVELFLYGELRLIAEKGPDFIQWLPCSEASQVSKLDPEPWGCRGVGRTGRGGVLGGQNTFAEHPPFPSAPKKTDPQSATMGPLPPVLTAEHSLSSCVESQAKHITNRTLTFLVLFHMIPFRKYICPTQQLSVAILVLNLHTPHVVAALVFSLCIFGSVFPLADLCLGAAKIKRAFWCRPGCLCKCRNAVPSSAP